MLRPEQHLIPTIKALWLEHQLGSRVPRGLSDYEKGPRLNAHTRMLLSPLQSSVGVLIHVQTLISIQHSGCAQIYLFFSDGHLRVSEAFREQNKPKGGELSAIIEKKMY